MPPSRQRFAAAMAALGITGLANGDFELAWQEIPLHHLPGYTVIAYVCAVIELAAGIGLLFNATLKLTCRVLFPYMMLWVLLLEIPIAIHSPQDPGAWGSVGEIAIVTAGAWCLFAVQAGPWRHMSIAGGSSGVRAARCLLIVALPMIGIEVIADAAHFGNAVMPPWLQGLPDPARWAELSGLGSLAAGLGLLFGVWPRLAAAMEATMLGIITVVYWGPDLYTGRTAITAFIISFLITAGAWLIADTYHGVPWFATRRPVWSDRTEGAA